jgi:hypothetical protein
LLEEACVAGDLPACAWLGGWYEERGNAHETVKYFGYACSGGLMYGCSRLAAFGYWGDKNPEAAAVLRANCGDGEPWACAALDHFGLDRALP